jgi:hypothetical protein
MPHPKCEHGKRKYNCKECCGNNICNHNKQKSYCKECGGGSICEHNRLRCRCKECKGGSICAHNKLKSHCKECGGSQICAHNKLKSHCKECKGSQICEHNRSRVQCKECNGSQICEHKRIRAQCKECEGSQICIHNKRKSICRNCKGSQICEHDRRKSICKECKGNYICIHNKHKSHCKMCGGKNLCKSSWCETSVTKKYDGYCLNCFIHLFPDKPNTINYKTKEKATVNYILEKFPLDKYTWITDRKIQDGCSRKRPDLLLDLGYQVIIIEIDENQHQEYDSSCENKRLMELSQDIDHRPLLVIRFNPDEYSNKEEKVTSCWGINKKGICTIKKTKTKEWNERLETLKNQVEYWLENKTEKMVEIIQLFYDCNYISN